MFAGTFPHLPWHEPDVSPPVRTIAFRHPNCNDASWALAEHFVHANEEARGRVCCAADIVDARLVSPDNGPAWTLSFLTDSRVYVGLDRGRRARVVVTHASGPVGSPRRHGYRGESAPGSGHDYSMSRRKIPPHEFRGILRGQYGPFWDMDLNEYLASVAEIARTEECYSAEAAGRDALLCAVLGPRNGEFLERANARAVDKARVVINRGGITKWVQWEETLGEDDLAAHVFTVVLDQWGIATSVDHRSHTDRCVAATNAGYFQRVGEIRGPLADVRRISGRQGRSG